MSFCHLHCHSSRSFHDGLNPVEDLVERAAELGQPGIGITEHGNLFSSAQFFSACEKHGIKGVVGMEAYEAVPYEWDAERDKDILSRPWDSGQPRYHHLTIWVADMTGWENLCHLHTLSYSENFLQGRNKNKPLIDRAHLESHSAGLMIGMGCPQSRSNWNIRRGDTEEAWATAGWLKEVFGDRVYMEVMANTEDQVGMLNEQRRLAKTLGIEVVATNDVHYRDRADGVLNGAHHILVQARAWRRKEDAEKSEDRSDEGFGQWYGSDGFYIKSAEEMIQDGLRPAEVEQSGAILDRVDFNFSKIRTPAPPVAAIPPPGADPDFDRFVEYHAVP